MTFFQRLAGGLAAAGLLSVVGCSGETPAETSLTLAFVKPTDGQQLLASDNENTAGADYQKTVEVKATDTGGRAVTLDTETLELKQTDGSFTAVTVTPTVNGGTVDFAKVTLPSSSATLRATVKEKGTKRSATATITVNVQLPRPSVASVSVEGDANHDLKLNATELPSGPPVLHIVTTGLSDGNTIVVNDGSGAALGQTTASGNTGTVTLTSLSGATEADYPLQIVITNALSQTNNVGAAQPGYPTNSAALLTLRINRVAPTLAVTSPANGATLGTAADTDPATAGVQIAFVGTTSADVGTGGVEVTVSPGAVQSLLDAANSAFTGNVTAPGEGTYTFSFVAIDTSGNRGSPILVTENFDFTGAVISNLHCGGAAPLPTGFTLVAATNSHVQPIASQGYAVDLTPGGDGQVTCVITVDGNQGGLVDTLYNGVTVYQELTLGTNHEVFALPVTLPQKVNSNLIIRTTDTAGNVTELSTPFIVDVQPPATPIVTATLVPPAAPNALQRHYGINLSWSAVGDDGATGTVTAYDVRYRPTALFDEDPSSPNALSLLGIRDEASFYDARSIPVGAGAVPPAQLAASLTNLPAWSDFSIAVRGVDAVGNYSVFVTDTRVNAEDSTTSGTLLLANPDATTNSRFGYNLAAGDFNGDGVSDVAVGEPFDLDVNNNPLASKVYAAYGQADLTSDLTRVQTLVEPETTTIERYGRDLSAGNAGDSSSTGAADDLLVSAYTLNSRQGRALLYFGRQTGGTSGLNTTLSATAPAVVDFRGEVANDYLGYTAKMVKDFGSVNSGGSDGLAEIVLSSPDYASGVGRVYLFWSRSQDAWLGNAGVGNTTGTKGSAAGTWVVPASTADLIFDGPTDTATCGNAGSSKCFGFGTNHGIVNVGDVLPSGAPDGVPDFAIPFSNDTVNRLYIFSGATLRGAAQGTVLAATQAAIVLTASATKADATQPFGSVGGFASEVALGSKVFGLDSNGGAIPGLIATIPLTSEVLVYADYSHNASAAKQTLERYCPGANTPGSICTSGYLRTRNLGTSLAVGDLDGDGNTDIVVGENVATPGSSAWVVFNTGNSSAPYDLTVGAGLHQARVHGTSVLGASLAVGDFNGDGRLDFVAGDPMTPGQAGEVRFFY